ncbi:MAG: TauD/TfdA dioxygenase family protein [Acidimicrobiales bacterium]
MAPSWQVEKLTPRLGAVVDGLDAGALVQSETFDFLHDLLMDHQVLVIPDFTRDADSLYELGRGLGPVSNDHHLYLSHPDNANVVVLEWGGDDRPDAAEWHSDMTYLPKPPFASVLQSIVVPPAGGDTLWASMYSVYDALPDGLRSEISELSAVHDIGAFRTPAYMAGDVDGLNEALSTTGSAVHPMVTQHPVTGKAYLNVSESFTRFVIGLSAPESARLLTLLFDLINRPDHHVRLRWSPGTVAIWDNRGTQHYAVADYFPYRRVMHRVAVTADARSGS